MGAFPQLLLLARERLRFWLTAVLRERLGASWQNVPRFLFGTDSKLKPREDKACQQI